MTAAEVKKSSKKRKAEVEEETHDAEAFPKTFGGLEIADEDGDEQDESDGEVDEFPEIDTRSDSEEDEVEDADMTMTEELQLAALASRELDAETG